VVSTDEGAVIPHADSGHSGAWPGPAVIVGKLPRGQAAQEPELAGRTPVAGLRSLVPSWVEVIVVADRGFGRTELARTCQELGFHYVLRIRPKVYIDHRQYRGRLERFPVARGSSLLLTDVRFRKSERVKHQWLFAGRRVCRSIGMNAGI
jgi:hypothetical protein